MSGPLLDKDIAGRVHDLAAEVFIDVLTKGEIVEVKRKDPETGDWIVERVRVHPSAAMMAQINAFLRNNEIKALPVKKSATGRLQSARDVFEGFDPPEPVDGPEGVPAGVH